MKNKDFCYLLKNFSNQHSLDYVNGICDILAFVVVNYEGNIEEEFSDLLSLFRFIRNLKVSKLKGGSYEESN